MKITPVVTDSRNPWPESGPSWMVSEGDRHVTHEITLAEALGMDPLGGAESEADKHRLVAVNHLRNALFSALRDGMPAEALITEEGDQSAFSRNSRLAAQSYRQLIDRPSHEWEAGLSPVEMGINNAILAARVYKHRFAGPRSETDRWWAVVIRKLDEALAISEARCHG